MYHSCMLVSTCMCVLVYIYIYSHLTLNTISSVNKINISSGFSSLCSIYTRVQILHNYLYARIYFYPVPLCIRTCNEQLEARDKNMEMENTIKPNIDNSRESIRNR